VSLGQGITILPDGLKKYRGETSEQREINVAKFIIHRPSYQINRSSSCMMASMENSL